MFWGVFFHSFLWPCVDCRIMSSCHRVVRLLQEVRGKQWNLTHLGKIGHELHEQSPSITVGKLLKIKECREMPRTNLSFSAKNRIHKLSKCVESYSCDFLWLQSTKPPVLFLASKPIQTTLVNFSWAVFQRARGWPIQNQLYWPTRVVGLPFFS